MMSVMIGHHSIEPAPPEHLDEAVCLLLGLDPRREAASPRVEMLREWLERQGLRPIYQAVWRRRPIAAATVMVSPGRTGLLVHSPFWLCQTRKSALSQAVEVATRHAVDAGVAFVQSLLSPQDNQTRQLLERAGYVRLTELIYMRTDLRDPVPMSPPNLEWRHVGDLPPSVLEATIAATYEGSLDCPALAGLRSPQDVVAGHRASGVYTPQAWWVVFCDGQPAGCVLVNDILSANRADVVYLGVAKGFRRRGIGKAILDRACTQARQSGRASLTLAVDATNAPAVKLYERYGFEPTQRRLAMVFLPQPRV